MKSNTYPDCYDILNEIKQQKEITYLFPIEIEGKELEPIDTMQNSISNKLADIFSLAMRPCAAAFIKEDKICLFSNYGVLSKIEQKVEGFISAGEYCNKIFNLMKESKLDDLKSLFYAKIASQQKSSFLTQIKNISKNKDIDIKKELSSKFVDSYESKEGIEEKFKKLFLLGTEIELCIKSLCSEEHNLKELSLEIIKKAEELFSNAEQWGLVLKNLDNVEFYNYKKLEQTVLKKIDDNNDIFNIKNVYEVFNKKTGIEIHAEILAKFISHLDDNPKRLDDIGISKPPCFLCGVTFSVIDKTDKILTHGEYFLQDGLEKVISTDVQKMFPIITTIELKDNISGNIRDILKKYIKEIKFTFRDKSINLEEQKISEAIEHQKKIISAKNSSDWLEGKEITDTLKKIEPGISILSKYHSQSTEVALVEIDAVSALQEILNKLKEQGDSFTKGIVPIKVNSVNKTLNTQLGNQQTSHWVGLYIEKQENGTFAIKYVDPMGHPISKQVHNVILGVFQDSQITLPFNGTENNRIDDIQNKSLLKVTNCIQYAKYEENNIAFDTYTNLDDCGIFIIYLLAAMNTNDTSFTNMILNATQSKKLGQELREYIKQDNINYVDMEGILQNFTLKGSEEYGEEKPIDYINSYFGKYTLDELNDILDLRINGLQLKNIKTMPGIFIDQNHNNISAILAKISASPEKTILVPLNLFNKHAVGLIVEIAKNTTIQVKYVDSLNKPIPQELKQLIVDNLSAKINFQQISGEQQKYANCGPEVIENFILYLIGHRVSQEKAIELHSKLVENALLNIKSSEIHLSFEKLADNNYQHSLAYLEQDYNNQFYNFDYENHQREVAGEINASLYCHTIIIKYV